MRYKITFFLLVGLFPFVGACVPSASTPPTASVKRSLTVLAAASLKETFTELGALFESQNPGVTVSFSFAGSQLLAQQLNQGAHADVFASANMKYMDAAITSLRVAEGTSAVFATNRLVIIFPKDNPAEIITLQDLAKPRLKLDLGDKSVPVGQYTLAFLDKTALDDSFGIDFKDDVLKNVVSYETDVKAVVSKVSLGEADAGVVYMTDYNVAAEKLGKLDIPDALNIIVTYPIAPIADSQNADLAQTFVDLVLSVEGQSIMAEYGFVAAIP